MHIHTFIKEPSGWYINLPDYIVQGGNKADLAMVDGADKMPDIIAGNETSVTLSFDDKYFEGSDPVRLLENAIRI